jgi:hypothetical protein
MLLRLMVLGTLGLAVVSQLDESSRRTTFGLVRAVGQDVATFCDRHGGVCRDGGETLAKLKARVSDGARSATEHLGGALLRGDGEERRPAERGTLGAEDRQPLWREPARADVRYR